ncbi:hypothetical protein CALVIDRAFT_594754 [Calocera viscosa TUFC12733]|uniref:Uncharacterized protein n=1 Tax=Calocera viscosa (strain TUFC12733) TaxID=1330018 RepID=A0A167RT73_CALVF|nr:hypothetical protein CALVIDRAFT_594754 [Calocera viscosa TUFC12733]
MASFTPYNISLSSSSPTFTYQPFRDGFYGLDGDPAGGWRGSFPGVTSWPSLGLNNIGSGLPFRETYLDGATVTLDFEGTAVYLCFTPTGSSFTFTVDNNPISTTGSASDPACAPYGAQVMAYASGLTYGTHTANVRVNSQGSTDFLFHGGVVTVGLNGTNPTTQYIDDTDPGWTYELDNGWTFSGPASDGGEDYNDTFHYTCSYGPSYTASYTFEGSSAVQLLGLLDINVGPYTVQLDNQSYVLNGSDLWREPQQILFLKGGLDPTKEYTFTLINYDASAPTAQQPIGADYYPCATLDALVLTKTTPVVGGPDNGTSLAPGAYGSASATGTSGTSQPSIAGNTTTAASTSVGAIVGGVVGGASVIAIIGALLWLFVWRQRQSIARHRRSFEIDPAPYSPVGEITPYTFTQPPQNTVFRAEPEGYKNSRGPLGDSIAIYAPVSHRHQRKMRRDAVPDDQVEFLQHTFTPPSQPSSVSPASSLQEHPVQPSEGDLNQASTQQLVSILNLRLREEYQSGTEELEPPDYEPDH